MSMTNTKNKKMQKALTANLIIVILLALCLSITTGALIMSSVSIGGNVFTTATFELKLLNEDGVEGGSIITEADGYLFEPGMTVKKPFSLKNEGTVDAFFRIYFENLSGDLAKYLEVKLTDASDNVLYDWTKMSDMLRDDVKAAEAILAAGEEKQLFIWFHMPEDLSNVAKNMALTFDLCADATQVKNNPDKEFDQPTTESASAATTELDSTVTTEAAGATTTETASDSN